MSLEGELRRMRKKTPRPRRRWRLRPEVLLTPTIPKPMHGLAPRVVLGKKWWDQVKAACKKATNNHCQACGTKLYHDEHTQWLEGHEVYEIDYVLGRMVYIETIPLCTTCHNYVHIGRLRILLTQGAIRKEEFDRVMKHGADVLKRAGLVKPEPYKGPQAEWADWRLVIRGNEYPPLFKSFADWKENR